ncbi:MAG: TonB-dependent receptor [Steroidobacteraceae bacterium]
MAADAVRNDTAPSEIEQSLETLIVTGTRQVGIRAEDSAAPIQVLDAETLSHVGQPNLIQALTQQLPSFNAENFGGDASNLTLTARLRGLNPNHTLVLVNGKRRHTTANFHVASGGAQGAASADLDLIPVSAIDHIEVLQDGAAAQYGTDAIAGVINIILKNNSSGGVASATAGQYYQGDGDTSGYSVNAGFEPVQDGYFNVTAESRYHAFSDRGDYDHRVVPGSVLTSSAYDSSWNFIPGYPYLNPIAGDANYDTKTVFYNSGVKFGDSTELYSFGSYGHKDGESNENYRLPNKLAAVYPQGFVPRITLLEDDYAGTLGLKSAVGAWNWDLSSTFGQDKDVIGVIHSANTSLYADEGYTPTSFHNGDFISGQWTNNLDVSRELDVGAKPLTLALGAEQRHETYEIVAGDAASRYGSGSQSYPGFSLTDAGSHSRNNVGAYVDVAFYPAEKLNVDLAARAEHYSDFGGTASGKLTTRYDFSDAFALRGTLSNGFRAPTLGEEYYSATGVSPTSAVVQLPANSAAAKLLGIDNLKPEKSTNVSVGLVLKPVADLSLALDAYLIDIKDRIVGSEFIYGQYGATTVSQLVLDAITANGNTLESGITYAGVSTFVNGADTRTRGVDLTASYPTDFGAAGHVDWSLSANYNSTKVTHFIDTPAVLLASTAAGYESYVQLFNRGDRSNLETASPKYKAVLGALYTLGRFSANVRAKFYGEASQWAQTNGIWYHNVVDPAVITDLDLGLEVTRALKVTLGASNLFNQYPNELSAAARGLYTSGSNGVSKYPTFSPYGFNGGYYYGRVSYSF